MTNMPEAKLAREAEIRYATIAMVTDYDCWHSSHEDVDIDMIIKTLNKNVDNYIDDPLCGFMVTNGLWNDLANGMGLVFDKKNYIDTDKSIPILIISGSNDPVGENGKGVKRLYMFLKNIFNNISIEIIKDARHEVFSEVNKEDNYIVLKDFLNKN